MKVALIGTKESKRTDYFAKAAEELQTPISIWGWEELEERMQKMNWKEWRIKIDPPVYQIVSLQEMEKKIREYQALLQSLEDTDAVFLNAPKAVSDLLDKKKCKLRLQNAGVAVTKMLSGQAENAEQLITWMQEIRTSGVFIKPVCFSGAAGVTAFRFQPHTKKMVAYTSCKLVNGELVNTKTLYCMEDAKEICDLLNALLKLKVMVERWHPKAVFQGKSYDLRVVYQFGHIAHIVVRQSKGPVTNLHLNNQALDIQAIGLNETTLKEIEELCKQAVSLFPGLSVAGIDILIEKNINKPCIIEMNGQGDLIYQDIYRDNRIYKEQIVKLTERMWNCLE